MGIPRIALLVGLVVAPAFWADAAVAQDDAERGWRRPAAERRARIQAMRERYRDATPAERQAFREERMRRMERFRRGGGGGAGRGFGRHHPLRELDVDQRQALREQVRSLPATERRELVRKLRDYTALSDAERAELAERFDVLRSLDTDERRRLDDNRRRWQQMEPERRKELRDTWRRFKSLPLDRQQELLDDALLAEPE